VRNATLEDARKRLKVIRVKLKSIETPIAMRETHV